jgi:geranylgeranyl diphosphate synthase type II
MNLKDFFERKQLLIDQQLDMLIPVIDVPYQPLFAAARYSTLGKGKRIRPLFALSVCDALGGDETSALLPACALELIHTYSMIHDDLPCMDNDDFRRGKPTLHKAFPESIALLAGDFLLTFSFELLAKAKHLSDSQKVKLITVLAQKSGAHGMIGGQVMDMETSEQSIDLEALNLIHQLKTGALITASVEFGAILGHANDQQMKLLQQFGHEIGLAFQIMDDIKDVSRSEQKHGKTIASDVINNKTTYVTLLGVEKSHQTALSLLKSALSLLKKLSIDTSLVASLAEFIVLAQDKG